MGVIGKKSGRSHGRSKTNEGRGATPRADHKSEEPVMHRTKGEKKRRIFVVGYTWLVRSRRRKT